MKVFMSGDENREYFKVDAPRTLSAPIPFHDLPTPTLVCRKNGEAWDHPFIAVYEPYTGKRTNGSVTDIEDISESSTNETHTGIKVSSNVKGTQQTQYIHNSVSGKARYKNNNQGFRGIFGVISLVKEELDYLYLGRGTNIQYEGFSIKSAGSEEISACLRKNSKGWIYSGKQAAQVSLRYYNTDDQGQYKDIKVYINDGNQIRKLHVMLLPDQSGATQGWGTIRFRIPAIERAQIIIKSKK